MLWYRRATWRFGWELASTVNVLALMLCTLLIMPEMTPIVDPPLRTLTGLNNAEDLFGHVFYLIGLTALLHTMLSRIDLRDHKAFVCARIELPMLIGLPALIGAFVAGEPDRVLDDFIAESSLQNDIWITVYWQIGCLMSIWILAHLVWALLIIRRESASPTVANWYLAAIGVDTLCALGLSASALWPWFPAWPGWWLLCLATMAYGAAAAVSWRAKLRHFGARNHRFTVAPQYRPPCGHRPVATARWWWLVLGGAREDGRVRRRAE
ncbi:MAG: hypothetical protein CK431_10290 [Mycobacterium sp.]|nr:MAG: hypothetical protein CK431_10290 [Mycobacterium sp.]